MDSPSATLPKRSPILRIFLSVVVFCVSLTVLFLAMRAVLGIGGFCAEGGPYQIAVHCPKGIAPLAAIAPITMIVSIFAYLSTGYMTGVFLFWSAIFLSLGWNFLEFAFYPPEGQGIVYGWLACGVMFIAMGLAPSVIIVKSINLLLTGRQAEQPVKKEPLYALLILHLAGIAIGVGAGFYLFNFFTS